MLERVTDIPSPRTLGIPLSEWRAVQLYALGVMLESPKKVIIVQAPTGSGKTSMGAAFAALTCRKAVYACHTKELQDQVLRDIPYSAVLKGRSNYPTLLEPNAFPDPNCADCDSNDFHGKRCTFCGPEPHACPYRVAKEEAFRAPLVVTNYAYLMNEANHIGRLSGLSLLVADEADLLEGILMDTVCVRFSDRMLTELHLSKPDFKGTTTTAIGLTRKTEEWGGWLATAMKAMEDAQERLRGAAAAHRSRGDLDRYRTARRRLAAMEQLWESVRRMAGDLAASPASWVRVDDDRALVFKPLKVDRYAEDLLWRHADRFLCMSATIVSHIQFCRDLGLDPSDVEWVDLPCMFQVVHRPIRVWPVASMNYTTREAETPKLIQAINQILDCYPCRVVIHSHTYDLSRSILTGSRHRARMDTYARPGDDPMSRERVVRWYRSKRDSVLIAPSMERGVSFPDDLCRCQIVCKTPYPNLGDRQVSQRFHSGSEGKSWYYTQTVRATEQCTGRGIRNEMDWCHTYILDSQFVRLFKEHRSLFADWWRSAVVFVTSEDAVLGLERGENGM